MYQLKQSTAITVPFFVMDSAGAGVTGIADGSFTKRISKNGGAFGAMTVTVTEMENGWYSIPVSTSHTDTLGFLAISLSAAGALRVNLLFNVSARIADDFAFPNTTGRGIDVTTTGEVGLDFDNIKDATGAHTLTNITVPLVTTTTTATTATNLTNAPTNGDLTATMKTSVTTAATAATPSVTVSDKTGFSLSTAGILAIWHQLTSAIVTASTIGKLLVDDIDATISSRTKPADTQAAVTTVTNLTNAPSAGDFTSTMKTSLNNATPAVTVSDKTGFSLSAAGIQAIWDRLTSALTTSGSIGKLLVDNVNATISSRSSHTAADVWAVATRLLTAGTNIVLAKGTGVTGLNDLDASGVRSAVGLASANLDTQLDAVPTANENADALLDRDLSAGADTVSRSVRNALRLLRNKITIAAGTLTVFKENDSTTAWTAVVGTDAAADPIVSIDP